MACKVEGMARNASMHAAGVVISPVPLRELVPLYKTNKDEIVTQYDMMGLEKLALLKMDFLGLTTLDIIQDALKLIEKHRGVKLDIEELPLDDADTYQIFSKGFTSGVFQFESPGMRDILRRYQPTRIEDLCALNALYRPGPIQGGMIDDFIDRKHGRKEVIYDFPELKEILEETYGVMVYQEQVMQISNRLAGYSLGEADILRRAMGKKKAEEMAKQRERFVEGAKAKGLPQKKVEKIFDLMEKFAGYGFNKSHSAAYAYLAYVTAYLKAHYPLEFMSALLTSETGNTDKVVKYINECREMGIPVLPPDVNSSGRDFSPDGQGIRFGLCAISNVGAAAVDSIIEARESGGPFTSLYDFCERVDLTSVNRRMIESFIKAGALASLGGNRAQLTAVIESAMESGQRAWKDRESGQSGLFGVVADEPAHVEHPLPALPGLDPAAEARPAKKKCSASTSPAIRWMNIRTRWRSSHARHGNAGRPGARRRGRPLRHPHRHPAQAQQGRQAVGRDADRGSQGRSGSHGVLHAIRSPADRLGGGSSRAGARPGAAGGKRAAQDLGPGHCAACKWRA